MTKSIVADTGPLISLEKIKGGFDFIRKLYSTVIIPPAVMREVSEYFAEPKQYLNHHRIQDLVQIKKISVIDKLKSETRLHEGEIQAISLAKTLDLPLLIEERQGKRVAISLGLQISGIAKQIAIAQKQRIIGSSEAVKKLQNLLDENRINKKIYDAIIIKLSE